MVRAPNTEKSAATYFDTLLKSRVLISIRGYKEKDYNYNLFVIITLFNMYLKTKRNKQTL